MRKHILATAVLVSLFLAYVLLKVGYIITGYPDEELISIIVSDFDALLMYLQN